MVEIKGINFLFGTDPEVFVKNRDTDEVLPPSNFTDGVKNHKKNLTGSCMVHQDGTALEFNTYPSGSRTSFLRGLNDSIAALNSLVTESNSSNYILIAPSVRFTKENWEKFNARHKELGCDPDWCAYSLEMNDPPTFAFNTPFRTGAGHLHIGWGVDFPVDQEHIETCGKLAKELDVSLGVPFVLLDKDKERRNLYGRAGCFRPKHYGMEYRTLSNYWLTSRATQEFAFDAMVWTLERTANDTFHTDDVIAQAREIIDTSDETAALAFVQKENIPHLTL